MGKKISIKEFRNKVSQMIIEEVSKIKKEEVNPFLSKVKDKDEMVAWVMRQYFDPQKHSSKLWYDASVTEDNVLDYISQLDSNFPLTPKELADLWYIKKDLTKLDVKKFGIEDDKPSDVEDGEVKKYQRGEMTFDDLSKKWGLTKQAMRVILASSMEKIKKLTQGSDLRNLDHEDMEDLFSFIEEIREEVAKKFALQLTVSGGDIEDFIDGLIAERLITAGGKEVLTKEEIEGYSILAEKSIEKIIRILMSDIENDDNLFKLFQVAVSRTVFPEKRGRPKKEIE